jgi:hypothetical protein|tara:strand:- start:26 stop:271 length:246 start_codon:yes stop_codon:yes gene_type:complete
VATYPIKHKDTGETKEVKMSIHDWDQWCNDNPDWARYYTPENAPKFGEVGEVYDKLKKSHPGWNDVLAKVNKMPGSNVKPV